MSRTKVKKKGDGRMSGDEKLIIVALVQPRGVKQKRKKMAAALQPVQKTNKQCLVEGGGSVTLGSTMAQSEENATRTKPDSPKPPTDTENCYKISPARRNRKAKGDLRVPPVHPIWVNEYYTLT